MYKVMIQSDATQIGRPSLRLDGEYNTPGQVVARLTDPAFAAGDHGRQRRVIDPDGREWTDGDFLYHHATYQPTGG
jgi:hypothetical protein